MKLIIPPTLQTIDLGDWNTAAKGQLIHVWMDPPRDILRERTTYQREYTNFMDGLIKPPEEKPAKETKQEKAARLEKERRELERLQERMDAFLETWSPRVYEWHARLWSQGPDGTHWTADELIEMSQTSPKLLNWLTLRSNELLDTYRGAEKKG